MNHLIQMLPHHRQMTQKGKKIHIRMRSAVMYRNTTEAVFPAQF
jgi:hypothetical protein